MKNLKEAYEIFSKQYPIYGVESILDTGEEWIFSVNDKESGLELDISPFAVKKETGEISVFFPPANRVKIKNSRIVDVAELKK